MFKIDNLFKLKRKNYIGIKDLKNKDIVLYGAGECSYYWFIHIIVQMYNIKPILVIDKKFKLGDKFEGFLACNLEDCPLNKKQKKDALVVVSVGNFDVVNEIKKDLIKKGFKNIISLHQIYEIHNVFNKPKIKKNYFKKQKNNILRAYNLLEDELSKKIFYLSLKTHITKIPQILPISPRDEQYFPKDLDIDYSVYINCGAYDGENIKRLDQKIKKLVCFEIDKHSYKKLVDFVEKNKHSIADDIVLLPCAIYNKTTLKRAIIGTGLGSRIDKKGEHFIQCVKLDDIFPTIKPTFVSMDIEGDELRAIKGMKNIIKQSAPSFGVCVYHNVSHMWRIINYLDDMKLGYKFYMRNYTGFFSETVLYAIRDKNG
jgi:FkbM family methyltransferase